MAANSPPTSDLPITDTLVSKFGREISAFRNRKVFADFDDEVPFINKTIEVLDDIQVDDGPLSLHSASKRIHLTPRVRFKCEAVNGYKNTELADLLLIITFVENNVVIGRNTILSQAKHANDDDYKTLRQWTPDPYQFYLLYYATEFKPIKPHIDNWYSIPRQRKSLRTYSFASNFWLPFFHSTVGMTDIIDPGREKSTSYKYNRTDNPPSGYQSMTGYLRQFVRGRYGHHFTETSPLGQFYQDLFNSTKEFKKSTSPNRLATSKDVTRTDGGEPDNEDPEIPPEELEDEDKGMGFVNIVVGSGLQDNDGSPAKRLHLGEEQFHISSL